jgi:DNA-binding CsgD family transcriptional regulator
VKRLVLIVEAHTREQLARELARSGYSCVMASSPDAALHQLRQTGAVDAIVVVSSEPVQLENEAVFQRAGLTPKERSVARYLLEGKSGPEIAEVEHNSPKTIRQHISSIYGKCAVNNRAEFFRMMYGAQTERDFAS